eukprot:6490997-Amphidinium_carterae.2
MMRMTPWLCTCTLMTLIDLLTLREKFQVVPIAELMLDLEKNRASAVMVVFFLPFFIVAEQFGGALTIITHSPSGRMVHDIADCGHLTVQGFVELHEWTNVSVIWRHHVLHSDLLFADYKLDTLVLLVMPHCPITDDMTEIRPLDQCKASATWSLAEFSFWHSLSIQTFIMGAHHTPCQSEYYGHDTTEYAHRGWLADIIDRRNQAIDMMSSWRNVKRRISRKRKYPTCSSTLMTGGASDSAIRQKLAKKATQAGISQANDLLQLLWGENRNSSELRQLWGTPPQVRARLLVMAKNSDHVLDPGKFFTPDSVFDNDPWGKFTGNKAADSLANSSSSSSSKGLSKGQVEPSLQIANEFIGDYSSQTTGFQVGDTKKVLHLAVYLRGLDSIEVKQRGQVLSVPMAQSVEIMIELYEETAPASLFLNFLKKDGIGHLLGQLKDQYTPQAARPHRVTGEVPSRIVRCFGSVLATKLLEVLALSGHQDCIIKPCQRHVEEASSTERAVVMQQVSTIKHHGVVRTRANRFIIRCTLDQITMVRQQVASDDLRFANTPALVVSRKWKVHHVPVAITAQRLSDALRDSLPWSQIPLGPSC